MDDPWSSVAERTEEESGRVLLTYFQGDVSSMVDQHFSRALRQTKKPKREITKSSEKSAQTYELSSSQWGNQPIIPQTVPRLNPHVARDGPSSSVVWSGVSSDALPPVMCSSAGSTVNMTEHHYNHSLMNFLYNDRSALATMMLPTSRPDHINGWTPFSGFED